ncbi:MAG: hypothetical protein CMC35_02320 [Flavobacteriaceae bacterium]|nr:hypothetical protein [Flavobacteriaceae bacterium]|tara:strand:- start:43697 stop:44068 length:372 start_codon:yes stop_codon:yes gene_type:complete
MIMALQHLTDFCELHLFDRYAILKTFENQLMDSKKVKALQKMFAAHFKASEFVLISDRSHQYQIDLNIYKGPKIPTLKGVAVVSKTPGERDRALQEQSLYDNSFAFFENLDDAVQWAKAFFRY